jgi:hypothetical protein
MHNTSLERTMFFQFNIGTYGTRGSAVFLPDCSPSYRGLPNSPKSGLLPSYMTIKAPLDDGYSKTK